MGLAPRLLARPMFRRCLTAGMPIRTSTFQLGLASGLNGIVEARSSFVRADWNLEDFEPLLVDANMSDPVP